MMEKIKTGVSTCIILLLFPYITATLTGHGAAEEGSLEREQEILEQWVAELLPGQMSVTYELEALKAQAIVMRSNLVYRMEQNGLRSEQLTQEHMAEWEMKGYSYLELKEIWNGDVFQDYYAKICTAVEETCGKVLQYDGQYVDIPYHALSAGNTRAGEALGEAYAYLQGAECPGEMEAENFLTVKELSLGEAEIISRDAFGYVTEIRVGNESLGGEEFRRQYDLASSCFELARTKEPNTWIVTAKGLGHGFGMSMYQAHRMAQQNQSCMDILKYFYGQLTCVDYFESKSG